ncbi:helix-turn-helix transcriptional regulator [Leifsonia sp. 21MFCrub1.1]|uniref:helix-turn-helix transcriptional regulator n=1 Tax=Leifsonia sp. 21MFCrub1.1 TaxID=1798223 RepID=UPI000B7D65B4|nr:WYL domain-containing protein [Leifsonia sp. 21MFCrub1.1]
MNAPSSRMLTMLSLLQARRDWGGQALADRLDVSTRTVRRDVDRLRELGYRIDALKGPDGGYRLAAGSELPPLLFDEDQAVALSIALQNAGASGAGIEEAAARALATVRQVMPSHLRHRVDGIRFERPIAGPAVDPAVLGVVSDAVHGRKVLRFDYAGSEGAPRRTEPHGLVARDARWYLVAWDLDRDDWRLFRLDRLAPRTPAGPLFQPRDIPTGDAVSYVAARFTGGDGSDGGGWPCVGEVVIDLPARDVIPWVTDGEIHDRGDGTTRLVLGSWSWIGLLASLARFDASFEIVGPPALADAAAVLSDRLGRARGRQAQ